MRLPSPRRLVLLLLLPLALGLAGWGWWASFRSLAETRKELGQVQNRRDQLAAANRDLRREVEALERDREARARSIREQGDVAGAGELLVVVPRATPTPNG
jgi:uncharacterized protein HemX